MPDNTVEAKYRGLKPKIADELRSLENHYFREDKPVPFKDGLILYPIIVRDLEVFSQCSSCLTLHKNDSPEGIGMTYLDFLAYKMQDKEEGPLWSWKFQKLCEIVFHISNGIKCTKCGRVIPYDSKEFKDFLQKITQVESNESTDKSLACPECGNLGYTEMIKFSSDPITKKNKLIINGQEITSKEFDRLRQIILFQNFPDYRDDSWVDRSLRKDYETRLELQRKTAGGAATTLEDRVVALSINTNYKFEEIWVMSIRKFTIALAMVDDLINYKIMKTAVSSGFASLPKGQTVEHWLYKKEKDMYGDHYASLDAIKQQMSQQ